MLKCLKFYRKLKDFAQSKVFISLGCYLSFLKFSLELLSKSKQGKANE